jgi:hypothetical protein
MPRRPPPWLFLLLILPGGLFSGFITTPLPFLLSRAGVAVDRIASMSSLIQLPQVFYFFWAPIADMKFRRRTWLVLASLTSALCLAVAIPLVGPGHLTVVTGVLLAGVVINLLVSAAQGGLLVHTLDPPGQAKASGWTQAGNLGGGAIGAGITLWLLSHVALPLATFAAAAIVFLPSLAALSVAEDPPKPAAGPIDRLAKIGRELIAVLRSRKTLSGLLLLAAPVGTGAAQNLLPAVASHFGVGGEGVMWVNGLAGGLVLALGSLLATLLPGDWDRRLTYAGSGAANALATSVLLMGNSPLFYFTGTVLYLVTTGFCYARFTALVLEVLGEGEHGTSTRYSLFLAAGNLSISYMLWLDGQGYRLFGTHGLFGVDMAANLVVFAIVFGAWFARRRPAVPVE